MVVIQKEHAFGFVEEKHLQIRIKMLCYHFLRLGLRKITLILEGSSLHDIFSVKKNDRKSAEEILG